MLRLPEVLPCGLSSLGCPASESDDGADGPAPASPLGATPETCPVLAGCTHSFGVRCERRCTACTEPLADGERISVEGRGSFTFDSLEQKRAPESCTERDPATGQAVSTGSNVATVTRDGDVACDDGLPFEIEGGTGGELCWPYRAAGG